MLSKEQRKAMLKERAVESRASNKRINAEIYDLSKVLYTIGVDNENVEKLLSYKMFDLIHSYLLNEQLIMEAYDVPSTDYEYSLITECLDNCDYSVQSNRWLIPALMVNTDEGEDYWYDVPHFRKTEVLLETIQEA